MQRKVAEPLHPRCLGVAGAQAWGGGGVGVGGSVQRREVGKSVASSESSGETSVDVLQGNELRASTPRSRQSDDTLNSRLNSGYTRRIGGK